MSKIKQAVAYERQLADSKVKAHVQLTKAELKTERQLREMAIKYERDYTNGQFGQLNLVAQEHRIFHEREHLLYEDAIEKASNSIRATLNTIEADMERFRVEASKWMTVERFEREHQALIEKTEIALHTLDGKIDVEEKVTLRSQAQEELLTKISTNNRWLIGILITVAIFGATTLLHVFQII